MTTTERTKGGELFRLVGQDQGRAFISDALDEVPDDTQLLSESEVSKIEYAIATSPCATFPMTTEEVAALCQTLRAAWAEVNIYRRAFETDAALREPVVGDLNVLQTVKKLGELTTRLAEVEAALEVERGLRRELKQIAQMDIAEVGSVADALGKNALTDFRSRVVALCREKAAEYRKEVEHYKRGDEEFAQLNSYAATADVLAQLLEQPETKQ